MENEGNDQIAAHIGNPATTAISDIIKELN
jgi:hypothetical protein